MTNSLNSEVTERMKLVADHLRYIFTLLSKYAGFDFLDEEGNVNVKNKKGHTMFTIDTSLNLSDLDVPEYIYDNPTPLKDWFVPKKQLEEFLGTLSQSNTSFQFNHLGFYYEATSLEEEKGRLLEQVRKSMWDMYQEKTDYELEQWLYIGDNTDWENPLIEFASTMPRKDKWTKYQLPQIHIDVNSKLDGFFIEKSALRIFKGQVKPFHPIMYKEKPVFTKVWLGIAGGVNLFLDFGTDMRMPKWHRVRMLRKVI